MAPNARRPGPLQDLPLACFLTLDTNLPYVRASPFKSASKRPRSPSALMSPTKRRILREEGLLASFPAGPREKDSPARTRISDQSTSGVLSPGRRLDFGAPSIRSSASTRDLNDEVDPFSDPQVRSPSVVATPRKLASSPEFSAPPKSSSRRPTVSMNRGSGKFRCSADPILISRELPPSPNRQCSHYPGFDVHYDSYIELPSIASRISADSSSDTDKEGSKENFPPRKKAKKTASVPAEVGSSLLHKKSNDKLRASSFPTTSYHGSPRYTSGIPNTHVMLGMSMMASYELTPGRTPQSGKDMLARKRQLEWEVDDVCSDEAI
ncbi:hypothetical protein DFH11DRAFT_689858 [Phellopilus nigrolimitatus]|nr:hypothetical protein DFH11DRAFT_689858 [Phellopilus nigrolimitatus]